MDRDHEHIVEKLDELLEITHRIETKDVEQDVKIGHLTEEIHDHTERLAPLEKRSEQASGALKLLTFLFIGGIVGIIFKFFIV